MGESDDFDRARCEVAVASALDGSESDCKRDWVECWANSSFSSTTGNLLAAGDMVWSGPEVRDRLCSFCDRLGLGTSVEDGREGSG